MKTILFVVALATTANLLTFSACNAKAHEKYSLKTVGANPIPKAEHFQLWKEAVLKSCSESKKHFNLAESECLTVVAKRADSCALQLSNQSPAVISTTADARDIGRKYLRCATPFYFCNGVEVKTEAEARAQCK